MNCRRRTSECIEVMFVRQRVLTKAVGPNEGECQFHSVRLINDQHLTATIRAIVGILTHEVSQDGNPLSAFIRSTGVP